MRPPGGRAFNLDAPTGVVALLAFALVIVVAFVFGSWAGGAASPTRSQAVAGQTDVASPIDPFAPSADPSTLGASFGSEPSFGPEPSFGTEPSLGPTETPDSSGEPGSVTAIVPGKVDRSSMDLTATYRVNAAIEVGLGALDVTTRIVLRNDSGGGIDRVELNTIAAKLGAIEVYFASVDDAPAKVAVRDQTLIVPLGGILPDGASATVRIAYRASLRLGVRDSDWMFSQSDETLALYRWIPWVSRALPFERPNDGDPFITQSSPQVEVEILVDAPMVIAAPAAKVDVFPAGSGQAWAFTLTNVRDVSVVFAPDFRVARGTANGIPIRAYTRPGGLNGPQLVAQAVAALKAEAKLVGVKYPWTTLAIVETEGGVSLESPGLVWVPTGLTPLNRQYAVYHGTAQQWFGGLVGSNQRTEPFADEAPSDLLARTSLNLFRASRCGQETLDDPITSYRGNCYYEVAFVQGGLVLDELRRRMGNDLFWAAMSDYLEAHRYEVGGTKQLLDALRAGTSANLMPILRARFPDLY